jgi:hypothetical protein
VTDNCATAPPAALAVTSDEPQDATGDGDTGPDWEIVGPHLVRLRAERAGNGPGRVYEVAITATDAEGRSTTQVVAVSVPKSRH